MILDFDSLMDLMGRKLRVETNRGLIVTGNLCMLRSTGLDDTSITLRKVSVKDMRYGAMEEHKELILDNSDIVSMEEA